MHANLCVLIEISTEIGMLNFWSVIICFRKKIKKIFTTNYLSTILPTFVLPTKTWGIFFLFLLLESDICCMKLYNPIIVSSCLAWLLQLTVILDVVKSQFCSAAIIWCRIRTSAGADWILKVHIFWEGHTVWTRVPPINWNWSG